MRAKILNVGGCTPPKWTNACKAQCIWMVDCEAKVCEVHFMINNINKETQEGQPNNDVALNPTP